MNNVVSIDSYKLYKKYLEEKQQGLGKLYMHSDYVIRTYPEEVKQFIKNSENKIKDLNKMVDKLVGSKKYNLKDKSK